MSERDPLLVERAKTHGSFKQNAIISQRLKQIIRAEFKEYEIMPVEFKEALDMICLKLSRIGSGQAKFKDHWDDIAGYAKLAAEACPTYQPGGITYVDRP